MCLLTVREQVLFSLKLRYQIKMLGSDQLVKILEHRRALNVLAATLHLMRSNKGNATIVTITITDFI